MQVGGQVIDSPEVVVGYEIGGLSGVTVVFESAVVFRTEFLQRGINFLFPVDFWKRPSCESDYLPGLWGVIFLIWGGSYS